MTKLSKHLSTGIATAALLTAGLMPAAFADTGVTINHNGADSTNKIYVDNSSDTTLVQKNELSVKNIVGVSQNTGGNSISKNVGKGNSIETGDATSDVVITVTGNHNTAEALPCGCPENDPSISVDHNGADSYNKVKVNNSKSSVTKQKNKATILNVVGVKQTTGKNKVKYNVGGENSIDTGDTNSTVDILVKGGKNTL